MKISKDIYDAHRDLSACSAAFLDFVRENPACLEQDSFKEILSTYFGYVKFHPWPTFIDEKTWKKMETAAVNVYRLITSIPERMFGLDRDLIAGYYRFSEADVKLMLHKGAVKCPRDLLGRGDFIYSPSSGLKCLEFNMVSNIGGGWQADALEPHYFNTPVLARFIKGYGAEIKRTGFAASLFAHVLEKALDYEPFAGKDEINTAVILPKVDGSHGGLGALVRRLQELYRYILRQKNAGLGGELVITDFSRLKIMKDSVEYAGGGDAKKIHVVVEKCNGVVPEVLLDVVETGNVLLFNGPISGIMSSKLNLALLSENENSGLFSPEERETIKAHVPWTRKVTAELEDYILSHREDLVLKPGGGIGGYGVFPGGKTSPGQWKQQVEAALGARNWVVQEYIPSLSYLYQDGERGAAEHHMVWGIFVFGPRGAGGFTRVLPSKHHKGVINAAQGARLNIILEVLNS